MPVFIAQGAEDLVTMPDVAKRYFDEISAPEKRFVLVPRAGHSPNQGLLDALWYSPPVHGRCGPTPSERFALMPRRELSRRDVLRQSLAAGVMIVPTGWSEADVLHAWLDAQTRRPPTAHVEMGPFYKKRAPHTTMLRAAGDPGVPLTVSGRVVSVHGEPVPDATVEVWQADHGGLYDLEGYRYRAAIAPASSGLYSFDSIMPGHYPARVARHVHYFVTAPGHKPLSTQLYFATDEVFDGNPDANYSKDPLITSRTLVRPVALSGQPTAPTASVEFELVLEKA